MGESEFGKCEICGKDAILARTYFIYNIPCQCCGCRRDGNDMHFVFVAYCKDCVPEIPKEINPLVSGYDRKEYRLHIENMMPYEIDGEYREQ